MGKGIKAGKSKKAKPSSPEQIRKDSIDEAFQAVFGVTLFVLLDKFKMKDNLPKLDTFVKEFDKAFTYMKNGDILMQDIHKYVLEKSGYDIYKM